jgi:hypothetical protein
MPDPPALRQGSQGEEEPPKMDANPPAELPVIEENNENMSSQRSKILSGRNQSQVFSNRSNGS